MKRFLSCVLIIGLLSISVACDKNSARNNTDLSGENLNGVSVGTEYSEKKAEAVFGKLFRIYGNGNQKSYGFFSEKYYVMISVDGKKIVSIISQWLLDEKGKVETKKGITNESSLADIIKAYGNNYRRENHYNEMGVEPNYDVIYTDSSSRIRLTFTFLKDKVLEPNITLNSYKSRIMFFLLIGICLPLVRK